MYAFDRFVAWRKRGSALVAGISLSLLIAGCSTDVQRFGYTSSLQTRTVSANAAPVQPVASAPLAQAPRYQARPTYRQAAVEPASRPVVSTPPPAPASVQASGGTVVVQPGDTAYSIARRSGMTVDQLARANGLSHPYTVKIGQRLSVDPSRSAPVRNDRPIQVAAHTGATHTVVPGDTLYNISRRYGVGVASLADANNLDDYGTVKIGQTLSIPSGGQATAQGGPLQPAREIRTANVPRAGTGPRVLQSRTVRPQQPPQQEQVAAAGGAESITPLPVPPERTSNRFRWPVRGRIISHYGIGTDGNRNEGINISVPEGASVKAAENGVVAYAGSELKGYGNLILIRHANDWVTAYAHNSSLLVRRGDTVKRGQIIAKAGQSGSVDTPQLHFEVRRGAKAVNPIDYLDGA